jgi:small-conductance mechanosensitive channel/CRP-like cAMP-binding protein
MPPLMIAGLALFIFALALRGLSVNRHVRARLSASAVTGAAYALLAAALLHGRLTPEMAEQVRTFEPLFLAFGVINALVALLINPWRADRLPERFPTIVQDAIVIVLFTFAATVLLQEKIFAATAASAVVVGFALQDTLGNLFAGLAIQIERPFSVGHWVQIANVDGIVSEINWRATKVRTRAGNFVVVPNSKLADDIIINYSEPTPESRIEIDVGVAYDASPNNVKAVMLDAIRDEPLVSRNREPEVLMVDFAASSITYRLHVWSTDFAAAERLPDRVRSAIYYAFRRNRIEIPYPIQVEYSRQDSPVSAHIDETSVATLRAVPIFASLSPEEHTALAAAAAGGLYSAGTKIVRQGDAGASMFVVVRGEVAVTIEPNDQEVARIGAGGFFGEMSLLTGTPRNATVVARTDTDLVEIRSEAFRRFVLANPSAVEDIGVAVANRRAELEQRRASGVSLAAVEPPHKLIDRIRRFLRLTSA